MIKGIKTYFLTFKKWKGKPIKNSYGGKEVLDFKGKPLFAELVVLRLLKKKGWNGVWVDTYGRKFRKDLPEKNNGVKLSADKKKIIDAITKEIGRFSGCWDIFAWKGKKIMFIELKRSKKDKIRKNQIDWLNAAQDLGISKNSFNIIEWNC